MLQSFPLWKNITLTVKKAGKRPFGDVDSEPVRVSVCLYIHMYVCICTCVCVCVYTYTHTYTHICSFLTWYRKEKPDKFLTHRIFFFF